LNSAFPYSNRKRKFHHGAGLESQQLLWRAVLAQAVRDICSSDEDERSAAILWIKDPDFDVVCSFAEVEAKMMMEQMASLAAMPLILARKYGNLLRTEIMRGVHHN
jgi:hypothetical protein